MPRNVDIKRDGDMVWFGVSLIEEGQVSASGENITIATHSGRVADFVHPLTGEPVKFTLSAYSRNPDHVMTPERRAQKALAIAKRAGLTAEDMARACER